MPSLDATALRTAWGSFYQEGKIGPKNIIEQIMTPSKFKSLFPTRVTKNTAEDNVRQVLTRVLQRFQSTYSALGGMVFDPETILLERVKINITLKPDELADSAMQFMMDKGVDRSKMDIVEYLGMYLILKAQEDDEVNEAFFGVTGTITSGTPTAASATRTGWRKRMRDLNAASKLNVITTGALETDPSLFVKQVEDFRKAIPAKYRPLIKWISMDYEKEELFKQGMDELYNVNYARVEDIARIKNTNVMVVGSQAQTGSGNIWTTPSFNTIGFIKQPENKGVFAAGVKDIYDIQIATDWYEVQSVLNSLWVWSNDQDLS